MCVLALYLPLPSWNHSTGDWLHLSGLLARGQPGLAERLEVAFSSLSEQITSYMEGAGGIHVGKPYQLWGWVREPHLFTMLV